MSRQTLPESGAASLLTSSTHNLPTWFTLIAHALKRVIDQCPCRSISPKMGTCFFPCSQQATESSTNKEKMRKKYQWLQPFIKKSKRWIEIRINNFLYNKCQKYLLKIISDSLSNTLWSSKQLKNTKTFSDANFWKWLWCRQFRGSVGKLTHHADKCPH